MDFTRYLPGPSHPFLPGQQTIFPTHARSNHPKNEAANLPGRPPAMLAQDLARVYMTETNALNHYGSNNPLDLTFTNNNKLLNAKHLSIFH